MGTRRGYNERIAELKRRREELLQQEKALLARQIKQERKKRADRWFRIGCEIEAAVGHDVEKGDMNLILDYVRELFPEKAQEELCENHSENEQISNLMDHPDSGTRENNFAEENTANKDMETDTDNIPAEGWGFKAAHRERDRFTENPE